MYESASSVEHLSVPDTASHLSICATQPATHTFTLLCANCSLLIPGTKPANQYQLFQWIRQSLNTLQTNDIGTHALTSRENDVLSTICYALKEFLLLRSNLNNTSTPHPMPQVLYNPVKVYNIDLRQTGSSFKKKFSSNCYSQ